MKIVLRDDDTCFYTKPEELETAFSGLEDVPISISVIPFAAYEHRGTFPYKNCVQRTDFPDIEENQELVSYLKQKLDSGKYELLLHGIHHQYKENGNGEWITEMRSLPYSAMRAGIIRGKRHLEAIFSTRITAFVGPSNDISADCAAILDELGINTNYMVFKKINRRITLVNVVNYLRCNVYRVVKGGRYAGVLCYRNHKEVCSFPFEGYEQARRLYTKCRQAGHPLVLYTHYWSLIEDVAEKEALIRFVQWATENGAEFVKMNQIWEN